MKPASEILKNDLIMFGGQTYLVNEIAENVVGDMVLNLIVPKPIDLDELGIRIIVLVPKYISVNVVGRR